MYVVSTPICMVKYWSRPCVLLIPIMYDNESISLFNTAFGAWLVHDAKPNAATIAAKIPNFFIFLIYYKTSINSTSKIKVL